MQTKAFTSAHGRWITIVFFLLGVYVVGAGMMDSFVVYHTWKFIGDAEFAQAHAESGGRVVQVFVLPLTVTTVFLILLFWHRATSIPRYLLWIALTCLFIAWVSSVFIQIPMQIELDKGRNPVLLEKLIESDWIRVIPQIVFLATVMAMINRCLPSRDKVS